MFDKLILLTRFAPFVRDTYNQRQLQKLGIEYQKPTPVPPTIARGSAWFAKLSFDQSSTNLKNDFSEGSHDFERIFWHRM